MTAIPHHWLCFVAAALIPASVQADAPPLAVNLGFERWNADRSQPVGWSIEPDAGYRTSADCTTAVEGACSLRIESLPDRQDDRFVGATQAVPARVVGGHALALTGSIRTDSVTGGYAGFWMRVDASRGPSLQFDNMHDRGPRGTTAWQRFRVRLPVAPNAQRVLFGALLTGTGKAWFDDLHVEVDPSEDTAAVALPPLEQPPRPTPSTALADDRALALTEPSMPRVDEAARAEVRAASHAVRSLFSDDYSDLQFLKPVLAGKRVVELGESAHGVAEFDWMKVRLVKFLHEQMGFDVIAFESSLSDCAIADEEVGVRPPREVMTDCVFGTWWTSEALGLFEYLDTMQKTGKPMTLAGFDSQNSGGAQSRAAQRLRALVARVDAPLATRIDDDEATLVRWYAAYGRSKPARSEADGLLADYESAERVLRDHRTDLEAAPETTRPMLDLAIQRTFSRRALVRQLTADGSAGTTIRDRAMADNLDFLLDSRYPGHKVVVWAHNFHIARSQFGESTPRTMGAWVAQRRGEEVYALGLFMGRGVAAWNSRELYPIAAPKPDSLEAVMASAGRTMSFVDISGATAAVPTWARREIKVRDWGVRDMTIVPARAYDGLLYIDTVTPPDYLK